MLRAADEKLGAKTECDEEGGAEHRLLVPAQIVLRLTDGKRTHDRHPTAPDVELDERYAAEET